MAVKRKQDVNQELEAQLAGQIPEYNEGQAAPQEMVDEQPKNDASQFLGTRLGHVPGQLPGEAEIKAQDATLAERKKLSRIGDNILQRRENAEYREGYIDVDRRLLGERDQYYPADWRFKIKPATVDAIRNWSTIDNESANSIDDVFNEMLKYCLTIQTPMGPLPWNNIHSWDRFFFVLLIREYTFINGETKIEWSEECANCDSFVTFRLTSQSLMYDMPDPEIMPYFSAETRSWIINPADFDVEYDEPVELYLPTLEKDANIKSWMISKLQQNRNAKIDPVFVRFLPWLAPKISKDATIAARQIRELEVKFKMWDTEMFAFMDNVLRNIIITPSLKIKSVCEACGEEVTADIRFPNGVSDLFAMANKFKKFGKK